MPGFRIERLALAAALIGASTLTVTGCTTEPQEQTKAEACALVSSDLTDLSEDVNASLTSISAGDIAAAQDAYVDLDEQFTDLVPQIEHQKVKTAVADIRDAVAALSTATSPLSDDGALQDAVKVADASTAVSSAVTDLEDAGAAINDLCRR